jgi:hypothetical protein
VGDNGWWEVASAAEQANYQPTVGVLKIQTNSVSDYRSYGYALPGINDFGLLDRWKQTYRWVHKYNDAYVEALEAANTSDGLKKFRLLPLAKLRAQQEKMHEDFFYETVFFGDEINEKQTTTTGKACRWCRTRPGRPVVRAARSTWNSNPTRMASRPKSIVVRQRARQAGRRARRR